MSSMATSVIGHLKYNVGQKAGYKFCQQKTGYIPLDHVGSRGISSLCMHLSAYSVSSVGS